MNLTYSPYTIITLYPRPSHLSGGGINLNDHSGPRCWAWSGRWFEFFVVTDATIGQDSEEVIFGCSACVFWYSS